MISWVLFGIGWCVLVYFSVKLYKIENKISRCTTVVNGEVESVASFNDSYTYKTNIIYKYKDTTYSTVMYLDKKKKEGSYIALNINPNKPDESILSSNESYADSYILAIRAGLILILAGFIASFL